MEHDPHGDLGVSRYHLALVGLVFAAVAGIIHGQAQNQREARNFFLLTNPHGVAGDIAALDPMAVDACAGRPATECAWGIPPVATTPHS
jgi:hypothetical protein